MKRGREDNVSICAETHTLSFSAPKAFGASEAPARPQRAIRAAETVRMHLSTSFDEENFHGALPRGRKC